MEAAYQSLGIPSSAIITNDTMNQVVQTIMNMGIGSIILFLLPWITTVASFVLAIIAGVKANKWYMNHCLRIAREVRNTTPSSVEQDALYVHEKDYESGDSRCRTWHTGSACH